MVDAVEIGGESNWGGEKSITLSHSVCRVMQSFTFPMKTLTLFSCTATDALPLLAKNYERDREGRDPTIDQIEGRAKRDT